LQDELVGDPACDVLWIWSAQSEDDVPEAGVDSFRDRVARRVRVVIGDRQLDRAGDRGWVPTDLGAEPVQARASPDAVVDVAAGDVPQVGMLGDHAQGRGGASADHDRRVRPLDGFGVAERAGKRVVAAELLEHSDADDPVFGVGLARVLDASRPLLLAAQNSGEIRVDLTLDRYRHTSSREQSGGRRRPRTSGRHLLPSTSNLYRTRGLHEALGRAP
jgi:hypothetical protein